MRVLKHSAMAGDRCAIGASLERTRTMAMPQHDEQDRQDQHDAPLAPLDQITPLVIIDA
jgi:hypothetical protein